VVGGDGLAVARGAASSQTGDGRAGRVGQFRCQRSRAHTAEGSDRVPRSSLDLGGKAADRQQPSVIGTETSAEES